MQRTTDKPVVPQEHPIFNQKYLVTKALGQGNTSKVYLGQAIDPKLRPAYVALKIMKKDFLQRSEANIRSVDNEITILRHLNHKNIVSLIDYGDSGTIEKPSGRSIPNLVYIIMEYVSGELLFDVCQGLGAMGEDSGRFFATQLLNSMEYMHGNRVAHRDLKLENILLDKQFNVKLADFGFACYKQIDCLKSYRGTFTYMAPEIKEEKEYKGEQVDMFSFGVILFIVTHGIFPFKEARTSEYFYNLLATGQYTLYFSKVNGSKLSPEFQNLIVSLFSYDPSKRPTISEIRQHPWMNKSFDYETSRQRLVKNWQSKQSKSGYQPQAA